MQIQAAATASSIGRSLSTPSGSPISAGQQMPTTVEPTASATQLQPGEQITGFVAAAPFAHDTLSALISAQVGQDKRDTLSTDLLTQFDANKDGKLSIDELGKALSDSSVQLPGKLRAAAQALKAKLESSGLDANLPLGLDQIKATVGVLDLPKDTTPPSSADIKEALHAMDTNGDNSLSDSEVRAALAGVGQGVRPYGMSLDFVARTIATLDPAGKGAISLSDIQTAIDHT
jgi:Ca2+-binding EF-hand superfamily protein